MKHILSIAIAVMVVSSSCNFEKRLYMKGYHVDSKSKNNKSEKLAKTEEDLKLANIESVSEEAKSEVVENEMLLASKTSATEITKNFSTKLTTNTVKNKTLNINSLTKKEAKQFYKENKKEVKQVVKAVKKSSAPKGGSDKTTLILLRIFLGGFAAHRWYAGKPTGPNILFIITAGGCLVWAIIDLIKIIKDEF